MATLHSSRRQHITTTLSACAIFLLLTATTSSAWALDGYQDRRGLFAGAGIGGGVGMVETDNGEERTGLDSGRKLGLNLNAIVGGGVTQDIVAGVDMNWWIRTVDLGDVQLDHHHLSFNAVGQLFVLGGFFVQGGGGLAYTIFDAERPGKVIENYQEMGLSLKGAAGFEYFVSSQTAVGFTASYTRHIYSNAVFDAITGGVTVRWY